MNKRMLSKIERPEATEEMLRLAERTDGDKYIVTAKIVDVSGEKILLLNFFLRSQLVKKKTEAAFRTFISRSDYITQDLETARVKWKTSSFKALLGWYWWSTREKGYNAVFATDSDFICARYYMKSYIQGEKTSVWDAIWSFQEGVLDARLKERHKKETDKIDKKMEMVPPKPEGFGKWVRDFAMSDKRYLIYVADTRKRMTTGYCTHCKKNIEIDTKVIKPRNKKQGLCPNCGSPVTYIPKGYFPTFQRDNKWVCLIQQVPVGIVARYFHVHQEICRDEGYKEVLHIGELCRAFFDDTDPIELRMDSYEWGIYKQHGLPRWCPDLNKKNCASAVVYTENLPEALSGTAYQYCALDLYQKKFGCNPIPVWRFMNSYPTHRYLEMFLKTGLVNLVGAIVEGHTYELNTSGKTPMSILGLPKNYIPILKEIDGTVGELLLLRQCVSDKVFPNAKDVHEYFQKFGRNDEMLGVVNAHMSIRKFIRYMDKQKKALPRQEKQSCCHIGMLSYGHYTEEERIQHEYKSLAKDWMDYISWCASLKYNMQDPYVLLPPDFMKAHDRVMKEYQKFKDEQERKRQAEIERLINEVLIATSAIPAMSMKVRGLMLVLPRSGEEIKAEGRALHHCVGTYVERVAKGETMILFVRKETEPEVPYFTLEYRDGKVIQCRGKNNCTMTKDVQAFVKAFERKMQGEDKKSGKERKVG